MFEFKNSNHQGNAGMGAAIAYFTFSGSVVALPLTDSQPYDLITEIDGDLKRIQIKTTSHKVRNKFTVDLRVKGGNRSGTGRTKKFDRSEADYLFVLTSENDRYLIPVENLGGDSIITLGSGYDDFRVI